MEAADDHDAAGVLPIYKVYRAIVRAAVAAIRFAQAAGDRAAQQAARAETDRYLELAERLTRPRRPVLYATSGISGSGKTTVAAAIVGGCEAVRLRSDVERKRLVGMAGTDRPQTAAHAQAIYDPATTSRVYDRLASISRTLLAAGSSVVVDAAANLRAQRDTIAAVAREAGAPLVWLDFDLPAEAVIARVAARQAAGTDASDATADVVRAQLASREPITAAELAATGAPTRHVTITAADLIDPTFLSRLAHDTSPG
jgi:predicted kinase